MTGPSKLRSSRTRAERVGVLQQRQEAIAHRPERRLGTGRQEQEEEPVDVLVGQVRAVDLRVDDVGDQVFAPMRLAVLDDGGEVVAQGAPTQLWRSGSPRARG